MLLLNLGVIEAVHPVDTNDPDCVVAVAVLAMDTTWTTCPAGVVNPCDAFRVLPDASETVLPVSAVIVLTAKVLIVQSPVV